MNYPEQITSSNQSHYLHHTFFTPNTETQATLLIVHGMCEHSGRYDKFAQFLADHGIAVVTYDQLGHGQTVKNDEEFGFFDEAHPVQALLKDVVIMADALKTRYPDVPHFIMGHSMGSFIVRTVLKHHAQDFAGAILMGTADLNPAINVLLPINAMLAKAAPKKVNATFADLMSQHFNQKLGCSATPSKFAWLSEDEDNVKNYEDDPLTGFHFTNNGFLTLFALMKAGLNKNWAMTIDKDFSMLLVSGANDPVGDMGHGVRRVAKRLRQQGFTQVDTRLYPNMRHEPLNERQHMDVYRDILRWILARSR
ncbi:alpha/beta fold hydrolase [Psychrobacter aestuarii]|uniref:Alpha/beta hydrolase n=1 Tax=Psychrobacter aestuarii TaxID=556327 RepID=A0ABN0VMA5_9GAMM|nr:alpha/beta fold hydrolase [Psychrobacter aestuarii]